MNPEEKQRYAERKVWNHLVAAGTYLPYPKKKEEERKKRKYFLI